MNVMKDPKSDTKSSVRITGNRARVRRYQALHGRFDCTPSYDVQQITKVSGKRFTYFQLSGYCHSRITICTTQKAEIVNRRHPTVMQTSNSARIYTLSILLTHR